MGAFEEMLGVLAAIGPALMIQVRNDQNNLRKLRAAMAASGCTTVRALLMSEIGAGIHVCGPVQTVGTPDGETSRVGGATLSDPSAAMALLWLSRSLRFTLELVRGVLDGARGATGDDGSMAPLAGDEHLLVEADGDLAAELLRNEGNLTAEAIKRAYNAVIRPYNSWLLRKTFDLCASQAPGFSEVVQLLGSGLGEADRELQIVTDMQIFCREGFPVVDAVQGIIAELELEDLRRV